jgi:ABC-2 type transport system ATP-binding protein
VTPSPTAISLESLTKIYRKSHLGRTKTSLGVENISLDVRPGEVFGLLGLNGSGKTTTIKLILGLLFPTSGSVRVFGHSAGDLEAKRRVGYLPEVPYFYKYLTARKDSAWPYR